MFEVGRCVQKYLENWTFRAHIFSKLGVWARTYFQNGAFGCEYILKIGRLGAKTFFVDIFLEAPLDVPCIGLVLHLLFLPLRNITHTERANAIALQPFDGTSRRIVVSFFSTMKAEMWEIV